jgi:type II secretory pathway predicted ATPase ExeA
MYESYWQLTQKPFDNSADPRFYYPSESHQAALLKLRYAIESRRGGALLAGVAGSGKTLLTHMLPKMLDESFCPWVRLVFPQMSTAELLSYLASELDASQPDASDGGVHESIRRIERFLAGNVQKGCCAVVIVDEVHLIDDLHALETLRLLLNFESDGQSGLMLLLSGQTAILPVLERMPHLEQRLAAKCLVTPFDEGETACYIAHRLKAAGVERAIYEPDALRAIHELTRGVARRINRLCDLTLLVGYAEQQPTISAAQVEAVSQELLMVAQR